MKRSGEPPQVNEARTGEGKELRTGRASDRTMRDRQTDGQIDTHSHTQKYRRTSRNACRQTDRQTQVDS